MSNRGVLLAITFAALTGCTRDSAGPPVDAEVVRPSKVVDFKTLYGRNCAGCHGPDGKGGIAIGLSDPVYLAIADDAAIQKVTANGVSGTSMPAFARSAGGMLTDDQIHVIVHGIRTWASPEACVTPILHRMRRPIPAMRSVERKYLGRIARHAMVRRDAAGRPGRL